MSLIFYRSENNYDNLKGKGHISKIMYLIYMKLCDFLMKYLTNKSMCKVLIWIYKIYAATYTSIYFSQNFTTKHFTGLKTSHINKD